jgi:hypothetical protein
MRTIFFLFAAALTVTIPALASSQVELRSLMGPFFKIYDQAAPAERMRSLKALIAAHPDLYGPVIPVMNDERLQQFIVGQEGTLAFQHEVTKALEAQFPKTIAAMQQKLGPPQPAVVYIAPSLFTSNGQVRMLNGMPLLVFGPDVQAYVFENITPRKPPFDVRALIAHEFFHTQHYAKNADTAADANALFAPEGKPPLYVNLWIEGLATCASMIFDGDGAASDALMSEDLANRLPVLVPKVAAELNAKIMSANDQDYRDFFWMSGQRADIPKRSAYGVGAFVADKVIRRVGLEQAMMLHGDALRDAVTRALDELSSDPAPTSWDTICH